LGTTDWLCEACETREARFVHYMRHADHAHVLGVDRLCAERLARGENAARRDQFMAARARLRMRWLARDWKVRADGSEWLRADGCRAVVQSVETGWKAAVVDGDRRLRFDWRVYPSPDRAKLATFDFITGLLAAR
jgi:hypothetical protein